jgi:hypothetical protein
LEKIVYLLCGARKNIPNNYLYKNSQTFVTMILFTSVAPVERRILMNKTKESVDLEQARELLIRNITFRLNKCKDISLLDLILKLLEKSM